LEEGSKRKIVRSSGVTKGGDLLGKNPWAAFGRTTSTKVRGPAAILEGKEELQFVPSKARGKGGEEKEELWQP